MCGACDLLFSVSFFTRAAAPPLPRPIANYFFENDVTSLYGAEFYSLLDKLYMINHILMYK